MENLESKCEKAYFLFIRENPEALKNKSALFIFSKGYYAAKKDKGGPKGDHWYCSCPCHK